MGNSLLTTAGSGTGGRPADSEGQGSFWTRRGAGGTDPALFRQSTGLAIGLCAHSRPVWGQCCRVPGNVPVTRGEGEEGVDCWRHQQAPGGTVSALVRAGTGNSVLAGD